MTTAAMHMEQQPRLGGTAARPVLAVLAGCVLAAAALWAWERSHWPVTVVRIDGVVAHADREQLKAVVARHTRDGFFAMDLRALRADLVALPWIRDASLRRVWPDTLYLEVAEHVPAAAWNEDGLLSQAGQVFRPGSFEVDGLAALSGPEGHGPAMYDRLQRIRERLAPLDLEVEAVHQDARRAWRVTLANGIRLRLGREAMEERLARFAAVWPGVLAPEAERIEAVDLRYTNGFSVAWRDGAATRDAREGGA